MRNRYAGPRLRPRIRPGRARRQPRQALSYNCSPSFNWKKNLDDKTIAKFQDELGARLQVPVHHPGRHPHQLVQYLPVRPRLRRGEGEALREHGAGTRVRRPRPGLHLRLAPAGSRRRLLRRRDHRHPGRLKSASRLSPAPPKKSSSTNKIQICTTPQRPAGAHQAPAFSWANGGLQAGSRGWTSQPVRISGLPRRRGASKGGTAGSAARPAREQGERRRRGNRDGSGLYPDEALNANSLQTDRVSTSPCRAPARSSARLRVAL